MKNLYKLLKNFFRVNWIKTIVVNIRYLKFSQACKFPVLIYGKSSFTGRGEIILPSKLYFGMIKLGLRFETACVSPQGIHLKNEGRIIFDGSAKIGNAAGVVVGKNATLRLGKNFDTNGNVSIHCFTSVKIGRNFALGCDSVINDSDMHEHYDPITNIKSPVSLPIVIGDNVWCCQRSMVLKGAIVPDWTTIGAMSVVTRKFELEPYSIITGIPAKQINKKLKRIDTEYLEKKGPDWLLTSGLNTYTPQK